MIIMNANNANNMIITMQVRAVHRDGKGAERVFHLWPMSGGEVWSMMVDHAMSDADKIDEKHQKILSD